MRINIRIKNLYYLATTFGIGLVIIFSAWMLFTTNSLDPRILAKLLQNQDGKCTLADITGSNGQKDGKIDSFDLSLVLANWNWQAIPRDLRADIWSKTTVPDEKVDMFDVSRVLYCWRITETPKSAVCGNGIIDRGETCDPPNSSNGCNASSSCSSSCQCVTNPTQPPMTTIQPTQAPGTPTSPPNPTTPVQNTSTPIPTTVSTPKAEVGTCTCSATGCATVCLVAGVCSQQCDSTRRSIQKQTTQSECTVSYCTPELWSAARDACSKDSRCKSIDSINDVEADWTP